MNNFSVVTYNKEMDFPKSKFAKNFEFTNKELIGVGSNGNRVYRVTNKKDNKVSYSDC
jgi:hypothetical protein